MAPARVTAAMFSMWTSESGVSRVIRTSVRRSLSMTSAQRWMRLRVIPCAIVASVEPEHGQMSAAGASDDPEAKGAVRSSSPRIVTLPGAAADRATNSRTTASGSAAPDGRRAGVRG